MRLTRTGVWRVIALAAIALVTAGATAAGVQRFAKRDGTLYVTRTVAYADIAATASETGTVNPVNEVQVGSEVSGTIATLNVDYNSKVTKGEVLAVLDPAPFQAVVTQAGANLAAGQASAAAAESAVAQSQAGVQSAAATLAQAQANLLSAQANVSKADAQLTLARHTVQRDASLLQQGFIAQNQMDADQTAVVADTEDYHAAQAALAVAQAQAAAASAQVRSAQAQVTTAQAQAAAAQHQVAAQAAQLQQAQYNLSRTVIRSPIDGIVMARNVSVGQTVAASFQTPTLFTLATNLQDMEVDTSVDEADVGNVQEGEAARISVTAFPTVVFSGTVKQVRVNPIITQNVVTYDAVVIVHDTSGQLKPGMTAQVTIDVATRTHVLAIPIAALLYRPFAAGAASSGPAASGTGSGAAPLAGAPGSQATLWVLRDGRPSPVTVVIGLSDGGNIEIMGGSLHAGDRVIVAQARGSARGGPARGPRGGPLGP